MDGDNPHEISGYCLGIITLRQFHPTGGAKNVVPRLAVQFDVHGLGDLTNILRLGTSDNGHKATGVPHEPGQSDGGVV